MKMRQSGCSVARYRATFGMWRSSVRIWPPRRKRKALHDSARFFCLERESAPKGVFAAINKKTARRAFRAAKAFLFRYTPFQISAANLEGNNVCCSFLSIPSRSAQLIWKARNLNQFYLILDFSVYRS